MNLRTRNRFKLHRLDGNAFQINMGMSAFADDETDPTKGGGGDGKGAGEGEGEGGDPPKGGEGEGAGGKAKPTDAEAKLLREVMEKKAKLDEATTKLSALEAKLKDFEGIDPVKIKAMLTEQEEAERKKAEARGEYDRLIAQMGDKHRAEIEAVNGRVKEKESELTRLQTQIAELTVGQAFSGSGFIKDELNMTVNKARVVYGPHFEFKDGNVVAYDKPAGASDRTPLVDSTGKPLNFDAALKALVEADPDKDFLLRSKVKPGAGSAPPTKVKGKQEERQMSSIDKIAAGLKKLAKES